MRNVQDCIAEGIKRSRGADDSLQALKDARFVREALAAHGWQITRWDTGDPAPPLESPRDEWSATPGAELREQRYGRTRPSPGAPCGADMGDGVFCQRPLEDLPIAGYVCAWGHKWYSQGSHRKRADYLPSHDHVERIKNA